jgi:hypothetical protein
MERPRLELAAIVREHGPGYRQRHRLPRSHLRAMRAIEICRTGVLGGHVDQCNRCGRQRNSYNSCRNRHCPKCGSLARARWLGQRKGELLPVPCFHVVFTLPEQIAQLVPFNQKLLLFRISTETLLAIARDPKHLGAETGFFGILHTWGQNLLLHPHVHYVVAGGGIGPGHDRWVPPRRRGFLVPVRVLSAHFRNRFLKALERLHEQGKLHLEGPLAPLAETNAFANFLAPLRNSNWVVYAKSPFGGPAQVLEYLGQYTHRVAISNHRLVAFDGERVTFRWKDYRKGQQTGLMTLSAEEFLRRFLLHVLPDGFQRIRFGGFLAKRHRAGKLALVRRLLGMAAATLLPLPKACAELFALLTGRAADACPYCHQGQLVQVQTLEPVRWPDTS